MTLKNAKFILGMMLFGYAFLYLPIITVVVFAFNDSSIVMTWGGFSTKWFVSLFQNERILKAAALSFRIAISTASIAILIGTLAAIVMVRIKNFKGRNFFNSLVTAPLVMPDVMVGLALLLLFVTLFQWFGWPSTRGALTITVGHSTIAIAYVILIVRARLSEFDISIEEAAMDLGAKPLTVFMKITLPNIMPAIMSGGLLAFTLSFDDVILASFLSGPGSTTLPMVIFSSVRFGISPEINAIATLILGFVATAVVITGIVIHKKTQSASQLKE